MIGSETLVQERASPPGRIAMLLCIINALPSLLLNCTALTILESVLVRIIEQMASFFQ